MPHTAAMLANHCLEGVTGFLLAHFPPGELEENILQTGAAQADADYSGAEFFNEFGQELLSGSYLKDEFITVMPCRYLVAALYFFGSLVA